MRRKDLEVTDRATIMQVLESCPVARLGLCDGDRPYVVPLNFAHAEDGDRLVFYFHCAREGRKIDVMRRNPRVCVEASLYRPDPAVSRTGRPVRYQSVIAFGEAEAVEDPAEKAMALGLLSRKSGRSGAGCSPEKMARVLVFKAVCGEFSCKRH